MVFIDRWSLKGRFDCMFIIFFLFLAMYHHGFKSKPGHMLFSFPAHINYITSDSLSMVWFNVVQCHIHQYFSYIVTGGCSVLKFRPTAGHLCHGQVGVFYVPSLPQHGHQDVPRRL